MKYIISENKLDRVVLKWLNKNFGNLTEVVKGDKTYYVDKNKLPLFFYRQNVKDGFIYFNYERIWLLLGPIFGLNVLQKREILSRWLEKSYNLVGLKPTTSQANSFVNRWLDPII